MARRFPNGIDLNLTELVNALLQILAADPAAREGRFYYHSGRQTWVFHNATGIINLGRLDQITPPAASLNLNSQRITALADPQAAQDATTMAWVQNLFNSLTSGMAWKDSARVIVTGNVSIASPGSTFDGVTLASGDANKRIVLAGQTAGAENGIYDWNGGAVALTRSIDADTSGDIASAVVPIESGTANFDTIWMMTTDNPTLGTTALTWSKIFGGASSAVRKFIATVGGATSMAVVHNFGTRDVIVRVRDAGTFALIEPDDVATDANTVTITEAVAPPAGSRLVTVLG